MMPDQLLNPRLDQAIELAAQWHGGTYRKGTWRKPLFWFDKANQAPRTPVMTHLTAVALLLQRAGWDDNTICAGFLHDILEDRNAERALFSPEKLRAEMGETICTLVQTVTEAKYDEAGGFYPWQVRKEAYIAQLRAGTDAAMAISLADKLHNLWTMNQSLQHGFDIFTDAPGRKALGAGPEEQYWFFETVLEVSTTFTDPRLEPLRAGLQQELRRFQKGGATQD